MVTLSRPLALFPTTDAAAAPSTRVAKPAAPPRVTGVRVIDTRYRDPPAARRRSYVSQRSATGSPLRYRPVLGTMLKSVHRAPAVPSFGSTRVASRTLLIPKPVSALIVM